MRLLRSCRSRSCLRSTRVRTVDAQRGLARPAGFLQRHGRRRAALGAQPSRARRRARRTGRFDEARRAFERSLAIKPGDATTLYNLGNALIQARRYDEAVDAYTQALAAKPDFTDAMVNLGNAESLRGDQQAALTWMRRALVLTPDSPSLHMNIANTLFHLRAFDEARAEYQAALALAPDSIDILINYGAFLLSTGDFDGAADAYRRAGDAAPALVGLSASYRAKGRQAEARAAQARRRGSSRTIPACVRWARCCAATALRSRVGDRAPAGGAGRRRHGRVRRTFAVPFVFDDRAAIVINLRIRELWPGPFLRRGRSSISRSRSTTPSVASTSSATILLNLVLHLGCGLAALRRRAPDVPADARRAGP